jgi:general secretion pathway protein H
MLSRGCQPVRRGGLARGFTLIELLVVLAIMAALIAGIPAVTAGLAGTRLRTASTQLTEVLRGLREEATRRGGTMELVIDLPGRSYTTSAEPARHRLSQVVDTVSFTATSPLRPGAYARIRFFSDGSSTGGTLRLTHGTKVTEIAVDWISGRVVQHD